MRSSSASQGSASDSLDELLRDTPADEKQGASATQGFGFQQWWAALCVAELLGTKEDFAVGMEVKEDVVLLDSATAPTTVEFCQIKTNERTGAWTLSELHKRGSKLKTGGYQPSTLAKLYKRRHEFKGHPTRLRFVSNASYKVPAEDSSMVNSHETNLSDLTPEQQDVIKKGLASQLKILQSDVDLSDMRLHKTNLPLGQQELFIAGKLSELCEKGHLPFTVSHPTAAARLLASELQSKASSTSYARSFEEPKNRLLTRADVLGMLVILSKSKPQLRSVLDEAIERLGHEQYGFIALKRIKDERVNVCADAFDRTNMLFRNIASRLNDVRGRTIEAATDESKLYELMESLISNAQKVAPKEFMGRNPDYVKAIALLVLNDGIEINVFAPATGEKSEEEQ